MRKILTAEELQAKQSRTNKWISIFLLLILLASTAGFAFFYNSEGNNAKNTNSKVQQNGNYWQASVGGATLTFSNSPESALNNTKLGIIPNINQFYQQTLYIDSNDPAIFGEIYSSLGLFTLRTQQACYSNCSKSEFVQKDCTSNLIVFTQSSNKSITGNQSCVFINGDLETVDAFLYKTFGLA